MKFKDFIIILLIFLLDRVSKLYIIHLNAKLSDTKIFVSKFINIQLVWNEGVAFGILAFKNNLFYHSLTGLIVIIIIVIIYFIYKTTGVEKYGFIMILGGSLGNVFDRLWYSSVPDFLDFHYQNFHWFIFNVADIFITIGVIILISFELILKRK